MRGWRLGAALAIAALAAVTGPAAYGSAHRPAQPGSPAGGWGTIRPIPVDEFGGSSTSSGFVFGGYSFGTLQNLDTAYSFDFFGGWTQLAPMPDAQLMSSAVDYPPTNKIYVFGGAIRDPNTLPPPVDYCRIYDVATNTWGTCPSLPDGRCDHACLRPSDQLVGGLA